MTASTQSQPTSFDGNDDIDVTALDALCRDILQVVRERDGVATATQIKQDGALSHNELHYRLREKLTTQDLVDTWTAVPDGGGQEVTHVALTTAGEQAIADGLLEAITDTNTNLAALKRDLTTLEETVDDKADQHDLIWRFETLHSQIEALDDAIANDDVRADLSALDQRLDEVVARIDDLDSRQAETHDALARRLDELDERHEAAQMSLADEFDARQARQTARSDALAVALNRTIARLAALEGEAARQTTVDAVAARLDERADRHATRLNEVEDGLDEMGTRLAAVTDDLDEETTALAARLDTLAERLDTTCERVTGLADDLDELAADVAALRRADDYASLSPGEKRDYWRAQAREATAEVDCRHHGPRGQLDDWQLLAHLEDVTLRLLAEEGIFESHTIWRARRSTAIPARCRHGWVYWLAWPLFQV